MSEQICKTCGKHKIIEKDEFSSMLNVLGRTLRLTKPQISKLNKLIPKLAKNRGKEINFKELKNIVFDYLVPGQIKITEGIKKLDSFINSI
jgi:hypothetical protein